ncbi:tlde1 domain-containing protein, partial [Akkermansia sp.]
RSNTYHPKLNLLASIGYEDAGTGDMLAGHVYQYDHLMRPVQRKDSWEAATPATTRNFTYNGRSELTGDQIQQRNNFAYQYDNIGNRKTARELEEEVSYGANELNQYTNIIQADVSFDPLYDADGNQTRIRTSTGIWNVCYDANDRPVSFTSEDGRTVVACGYDYQGRRFEKKVLVNGAAVSHAYYLYRGYLQVAELNLTHPQPVLEKSYLWDPTEPAATRILMVTCWKENGMVDGEHLFFTHDALKNVTSIFDEQQARRARYECAPFGALLTAQGDMAQDNRFRFSCEYADDELGLVYYNYRHLNPFDGRWINRDPITESGGINLYAFAQNKILNHFDILGLICKIEYSIKIHTILIRKIDKDGNILRFTTSRVFSGNGDGKNNPDNAGNKDNGPIPPGKYYVIKRQSGGIRSQFEDWTYKMWNDNDKTQWLAFIAIDGVLDDQKEINGVFRSSFRMHYGTRSLGCITFLDKDVFEKVREFILETESKTVKGADGTEYIYYGILEVKEE